MAQVSTPQPKSSTSTTVDPYRDPSISYFNSLKEAKRHIKNDDVLLVEGATWCVHSRRIAPYVRKLAQEGVKVIYADRTDDFPDQSAPLPALSVYSRGRLIDSMSGGPTEKLLREFYFESLNARPGALARDMLKKGTEVEAAKRVLLTTLEIADKENRGMLIAIRGISDYAKAHPEDKQPVSTLLSILKQKPFGDLTMSLAASLQDLRKENQAIDQWFLDGAKMQGTDDRWFALTLKQYQKASEPADRTRMTQLAGDTSVAPEIRLSAYHTLFWNFALRVMCGNDERRSFAQLTKSIVDEKGSGPLADVSKHAFTLFPEVKKLLDQK